MKLRARLALTLSLATASLLVLLGWAQSRWHSQLRGEALGEAAVHRMESGERERCEADPAGWPGPQSVRRSERRPGPAQRRLPPYRIFAYGADFQSLNPENPPFPPELASRACTTR